MAIHCRIHLKDECGKEHVKTETTHRDEATATLSLVSTETVKGIVKVRNVKAIPYENLLFIQGNYSRTVPKDWSEGVITHADLLHDNLVILNERQVIRKHLVRDSCVCHKESGAGPIPLHERFVRPGVL
jgi:hypothetical protein